MFVKKSLALKKEASRYVYHTRISHYKVLNNKLQTDI